MVIPTGNVYQRAIGPSRKGTSALKSPLSDVPIHAILTRSLSIFEVLDRFVRRSRKGKLQEGLEVQPLNLLAPTFCGISIQVPAKVIRSPQVRNAHPSALGRALDRLPGTFSVVTRRTLGVLVFDPVLAADGVFP